MSKAPGCRILSKRRQWKRLQDPDVSLLILVGVRRSGRYSVNWMKAKESLINVYFRQDGVGARSGNLENLNIFSIFLRDEALP